jgi:hypothetical protein
MGFPPTQKNNAFQRALDTGLESAVVRRRHVRRPVWADGRSSDEINQAEGWTGCDRMYPAC